MDEPPTPRPGTDAASVENEQHHPAEPSVPSSSTHRGCVGRLLPWVLLVALIGVVALLSDASLLVAIAAVLIGAAILRIGWFFLQQFATPPPPPPDPGTLRKVRLTYRCPVCGAEVRMTSAATEDPEPPRHCMEEMELVSSEE